MKKTSVVVLILLLSSLVFAQQIYTAPKAPSKMKIDGKLDEWSNVPYINLDSAEYLVLANRNWAGPQDLSGKIYVMWDEEYLYLACDIVDNVVLQEKEGSYLFQGDTIEIYLRMNYLVDAGKTYYTTDDYQFGFTPGTDALAPDWHVWNNSRLFTDVQVEAQKTEKGYFLEIAIPIWEMDLEEELEEYLEIGFDVAIDDVDNTNATDTELQLAWSKSAQGWADPTVFQLLILGRGK